MPWKDKSVLVTGGCGFIGANLVARLLDGGARVRVVDDLSVGRLDALGDYRAAVDFVEGDVRNATLMAAACRDAEVVFHLAAQPGVIPSILDPETDFDINARGTFTTLQAAQQAGASSFVYASSNAAVGEFGEADDETAPPRPLCPYGASKLAGEAYCSAFAGSYGMRAVSLRFANVYGPGSTHKQSVVARFIRKVMDGEELTIYGDGEQIRDYIHVDDLCRAIQLAGEADTGGEVINIASGRETSVLELIALLERAVGRSLATAMEAARDGEARRIAPSIEKAKRILGFEAQVDLAEGLAGTFAWFRERAVPEVAR